YPNFNPKFRISGYYKILCRVSLRAFFFQKRYEKQIVLNSKKKERKTPPFILQCILNRIHKTKISLLFTFYFAGCLSMASSNFSLIFTSSIVTTAVPIGDFDSMFMGIVIPSIVL